MTERIHKSETVKPHREPANARNSLKYPQKLIDKTVYEKNPYRLNFRLFDTSNGTDGQAVEKERFSCVGCFYHNGAMNQRTNQFCKVYQENNTLA